MGKYEVRISNAARRVLRSLESRDRTVAGAVMTALSDNPRPSGCQKLSGSEDLWRIRFGRFRIVYRIEDARLLVLVVKIGDRKDVYR